MNCSARRLTFLLPILVVTLFAATSGAQQGPFGVGFQQNMSRFIDPPRSLNQLLSDATDAIRDERYSDAIVILGDLLERNVGQSDDPTLAGQDFFLEISDGDRQWLQESLLGKCRDLIGELPAKAIDTYELRYGALASKILQEATADRDFLKLREVRRKYFHTKAGYRASMLLAQHEIHLGHPLAASLLLDDVVTSEYAITELGDQVRIVHATACRVAGRPIPRELASTDVSVRLGESDSPETVSDLKGWIDQHFSIPTSDTVSRSSDYPMLGGDASRNETADGQLPLATPRWMLETAATPREEQLLRQKTDEMATSGRLVPPSWTPIRVGDQLLMRTTERLRGVDFRTGKRVWQYPWFQSDDSLETEQVASIPGQRPRTATEKLARQVFNDVPYGQITSDSERVYLLDDLSPYQVLQVNALMGVRNVNAADGGKNTLVALELDTEGKIRWRLGQNPTVESELNEAFFLGAPIAIDGALYAMVELAGDILLVCLDPATGELRWRQQLVAIEGAGIQFDPIRRIAGATPSYHEGVLICPTGAGATVAVDLADRTLRWGKSYPRRAISGNLIGLSHTQQSSDALLQRWHNSAAIANNTDVLVTPVATDNLYCFDLVDGKEKFRKSRQAAFYVAGVRDGHLLMVGAREIVSHSMENGRLQWRTDQRLLSAGHQIVGRGVFGDACYIVPTSGNELVQISLADGSVAARRTTHYPLGNLIAVDGEIISQSSTQLAVAFGSETLGPRVDRILQEDPDNLDALIQKALLLSERGDREQALGVLERARKIDPESDDVLMLSISSMLGELRDNPNPPADLEEELERLIDTPSQRLEFLALRIQSALRNENVQAATKRLLEFTTVLGNITPIGNEDESILRDSARQCSLDSWTAGRAAEVIRLAEEQGKVDAVRDQVDEHMETKQLGSTKLLTSIVKQLHPIGVGPAVTTLAERRMDEGELFLAERMLLGASPIPDLLDNPSRLDLQQAATLADVYRRGRFGPDALAIIDALLEQTESDPENDATLQRLAEQRPAIVSEVAIDSRQVDVSLPVTLNWQSQTMPGGARSTFDQRVVPPSLQGGRTFQGWRVVNSGGAVQFQDPNGDALPLPLDEYRNTRVPDRKAKLSGGLLLLERPGRISALDLFALRTNRRSEALLWSRDFGADGSSNTTRKTETSAFGDASFSYPTNSGAANLNAEFRVGPILGDRLLVLQAGDLISIDATTGETMWRNSDAPNLGRILVDGHRVAVVSYLQGIYSRVDRFNLLDGKKLDSGTWEHGRIWATAGKHVLSYLEGPKSSIAKLQLVDPFSDQVKLELETPVQNPLRKDVGQAAGRILQDRYMVLFDTTGRLVIWDLQEGTELARHQTDEMPRLETMQAIWMEGQILVLPADEVIRSRGDMMTQHGETHRTVHRMIAVSTETGEINWSREFDEPWGVTITQPFASPVLLMARSKTIYTINRQTPKMDVAMLRVSDGEIINEELERVVSPRSTGLTTVLSVQPRQNRIRARIDGEILLYDFAADEPAGQPLP